VIEERGLEAPSLGLRILLVDQMGAEEATATATTEHSHV